MSVLADEQAKYAEMWTFPQYRQHSPGEDAVKRFARVIQEHGLQRPVSVYDFGCGEGKGSIELSSVFDCGVYGWDFVDVRSIEACRIMDDFTCAPLWSPTLRDVTPHCGYCVDVMEHIPPEFTMLSVANMLRHCDKLYLEISTEPDAMGALIGQPLHLTVQPFTWWRDRLREIANVVDARDMMGRAAFLIQELA